MARIETERYANPGPETNPAHGFSASGSDWAILFGAIRVSAVIAFYSPNPPSTASTCPVIKCGAVAKNITAAAISGPVPFRFIGV